jgi:16S rRNA (uracil1498-N3)-methyltransferase
MRRFFVKTQQIEDDLVTITGQDAKHLGKVLRLSSEDEIQIFDGSGVEYLVKLTSVKPSRATGIVLGRQRGNTESPLKVNLVQALPKQGKMELIIQKCTELGVGAIYPVETDRTVVKLEGAKGGEKTERWQKVAVEAAKQCGRSYVPKVFLPQSLSDLLKLIVSKNDTDTALIMLWEGEKARGLKKVLSQWETQRDKPELFLLIGPEGGFTKEEVNKVQACGGQMVTLGPRILRTETAGMVALGAILYHLGDLGGQGL